jgi:hypothetical protein
MPDPVPDYAPVVCSLGQRDLARRQRRWRALTSSALLDVAPTDHGLRMRFRADPGAEAELRDLAALERDCCSFATWTVHSSDDAHVMDIRGSSQEAVAAVRAMFAGIRTALC